MEKQYIKFEELVSMLEKDKNIDSKTINERIFKEHSYVSIINPYKDYICLNHVDGEHRVYPNEVNFDDFKQLKMIDNFISNRLFVYIRTFEEDLTANLYLILSNKMATLGDVTCSNYSVFEELFELGENQLGMLNIYHRYENTKIIEANDKIVKKNREVITKFIQLGKKEITLNNDLFNHYEKKHHQMPVWVVLEQLTFGELQTLFNLLKLKDRVSLVEQICKERKNNRYVSSFSNKINYIRLLRNRVCHHIPILPFINSLKNEAEKQRLNSIIKLLKKNYYESEIHDEIEIKKPSLVLEFNENNYKKISFVKKLIKIV